jgi:hypothetical protein
MTSNETWAGMIAMNLRYTVHCEPCERFVDIDLAKMPPDGKAIGRTFRCSQCGKPGRSIVSPLGALRSVPRNRV